MSTPIVILTGFLGAGKTTLLKRCLLNDAGLRIALVRNEFTAAEEELTLECPILLRAEDEEEFASFWELPNSCVCCTLKSQFTQGVTKMVTKARKCGKPFDLVIVEISGVADPSSVASSLISEEDPEAKEEAIRLGGIVSVVDVARIDRHLDLKNAQTLLSAMSSQSSRGTATTEDGLKYLLLKQICSSDMVILNKQDLVTEARILEVQSSISQLVLGALIVPTVHCVFDLNMLRQLVETRKPTEASTLPTVHSHAVNIDEGFSIPGLTKYVWTTEKPVDVENFEERLLRYIWTMEEAGTEEGNVTRPQLFRAKGILASATDPAHHHFEVQVVGDNIQMTPVRINDLEKSCCLFVGINLPLTELQASLEASVVPA